MTGKTISHFKVLEKLGGGGMGVVYVAEDLKLKRRVALKFLPPHLSTDEDAKRRFMLEAEAASALNHPNICTVHEIGETDDDQLFIAMAHYEGETLKKKVERGPMEPSEAVKLAQHIADGLARAHEKGITHRDIKPANIMVTRDGRAVILDFGLAKLSGGVDLTKSSSTVGTAAYMSPEQVRGESVDHRSDIWSLGVVLYEMLAGKRPFEGEYEQAVSYAILNDEPVALPEVIPSADKLNEVVGRCLQKNADDRPESAAFVASALRSVEMSSSVAATATLSTRTERRTGRPFPLWAAGAVALLAVIAFAYLLLRPVSDTGSPLESPDRSMLVVLPFKNLGAAEDEFLASGISDEITTRLTSLKQVGVIARNSAARYANSELTIPEIGEELGAGFVLDGTVRWVRSADGSVRVGINPTLIRVSDNTELWSQTYDRELADVLSVQAEVASRVVDELDLALGTDERGELLAALTDNVDAYQSYLRGMAQFSQSVASDNLQKAADHFERATMQDPGFVSAHYWVARLYSTLVWFSPPSMHHRYIPKARESAATVRQLKPESVEDNLAHGYLAYYVDVDFDQALRYFSSALEERPNDGEVLQSVGLIYRRVGRFGEAARMMEKYTTIDPLNAWFARETGDTYRRLRQFGNADRLYEIAMQADPGEGACPRSHNFLAWNADVERARAVEAKEPLDNLWKCTAADAFEGQFAAAADNLESMRSAELNPRGLTAYYFFKAYTYQLAGRSSAALATWDSLRVLTEVSPGEMSDYRGQAETERRLALAASYAGLGDKKSAMEMIQSTRRHMLHDRWLQADMRVNLARILMIAGFEEEAIATVEEDLGAPEGHLTGHLLASPEWDALRGHPRFQRLAAKYSSPG